MDFSHYPRLENDLVCAAVWPRPPDGAPFKSLPRFARRNIALAALAPGESLVAYHSAPNFTRFIGSIASDQPIRVGVWFSNDECDDAGDYVSDRNIASLHWDVEVHDKVHKSDGKHGGLWFVRLGKWMKMEITNVGEAPTEALRFYVRGSTL